MIGDETLRSTSRGRARRADLAETQPRPLRRGAALVGEPWNRQRRKSRGASACLLTAQEERDLAARIQAGDLSAREELVLANLRLVLHVVRDYPKSAVPREDLVQEGNIGLIRAAQNFDPIAHPVRFATYATFWIRAFIQRAMGEGASLIRFPEYARLLRARYLRLVREIGGLDDPIASPDSALELQDLAQRLRVPARRLDRARLTLIERVSQGDLDESIADRDRPVDAELMNHEARQALHDALAALNPFEAWIVRNRYGLDDPDEPLPRPAPRAGDDDQARRAAPSDQLRSYHRLGLDCGLPGHRVRAIEKAALEKLRLILNHGPSTTPTPQSTTADRPPTARRGGRFRVDAPCLVDIA